MRSLPPAKEKKPDGRRRAEKKQQWDGCNDELQKLVVCDRVHGSPFLLQFDRSEIPGRWIYCLGLDRCQVPRQSLEQGHDPDHAVGLSIATRQGHLSTPRACTLVPARPIGAILGILSAGGEGVIPFAAKRDKKRPVRSSRLSDPGHAIDPSSDRHWPSGPSYFSDAPRSSRSASRRTVR